MSTKVNSGVSSQKMSKWSGALNNYAGSNKQGCLFASHSTRVAFLFVVNRTKPGLSLERGIDKVKYK